MGACGKAGGGRVPSSGGGKQGFVTKTSAYSVQWFTCYVPPPPLESNLAVLLQYASMTAFKYPDDERPPFLYDPSSLVLGGGLIRGVGMSLQFID